MAITNYHFFMAHGMVKRKFEEFRKLMKVCTVCGSPAEIMQGEKVWDGFTVPTDLCENCLDNIGFELDKVLEGEENGTAN